MARHGGASARALGLQAAATRARARLDDPSLAGEPSPTSFRCDPNLAPPDDPFACHLRDEPSPDPLVDMHACVWPVCETLCVASEDESPRARARDANRHAATCARCARACAFNRLRLADDAEPSPSAHRYCDALEAQRRRLEDGASYSHVDANGREDARTAAPRERERRGGGYGDAWGCPGCDAALSAAVGDGLTQASIALAASTAAQGAGLATGAVATGSAATIAAATTAAATTAAATGGSLSSSGASGRLRARRVAQRHLLGRRQQRLRRRPPGDPLPGCSTEWDRRRGPGRRRSRLRPRWCSETDTGVPRRRTPSPSRYTRYTRNPRRPRYSRNPRRPRNLRYPRRPLLRAARGTSRTVAWASAGCAFSTQTPTRQTAAATRTAGTSGTVVRIWGRVARRGSNLRSFEGVGRSSPRFGPRGARGPAGGETAENNRRNNRRRRVATRTWRLAARNARERRRWERARVRRRSRGYRWRVNARGCGNDARDRVDDWSVEKVSSRRASGVRRSRRGGFLSSAVSSARGAMSRGSTARVTNARDAWDARLAARRAHRATRFALKAVVVAFVVAIASTVDRRIWREPTPRRASVGLWRASPRVRPPRRSTAATATRDARRPPRASGQTSAPARRWTPRATSARGHGATRSSGADSWVDWRRFHHCTMASHPRLSSSSSSSSSSRFSSSARRPRVLRRRCAEPPMAPLAAAGPLLALGNGAPTSSLHSPPSTPRTTTRAISSASERWHGRQPPCSRTLRQRIRVGVAAGAAGPVQVQPAPFFDAAAYLVGLIALFAVVRDGRVVGGGGRLAAYYVGRRRDVAGRVGRKARKADGSRTRTSRARRGTRRRRRPRWTKGIGPRNRRQRRRRATGTATRATGTRRRTRRPRTRRPSRRGTRFAVLFARGGVARVSRSRRDTPRAIVGGSRSRPRFFSRLWRCVAAPPFRARTRVGGIDFTRRQTPR